MVIETKERHAGESVLISALPLPFGFTPEGVEIALIDQRTLSLVEHAVPGGRDVFVHLLYYATISPQTTMQRSLFAATGESNDEAIALISSVEVLAKPVTMFQPVKGGARNQKTTPSFCPLGLQVTNGTDTVQVVVTRKAVIFGLGKVAGRPSFQIQEHFITLGDDNYAGVGWQSSSGDFPDLMNKLRVPEVITLVGEILWLLERFEQGEDQAGVVLPRDDPIMTFQVLPEFTVVLQPPQRRLGEKQEFAAFDAQRFQVSDGRDAVGGIVAGVSAVFGSRKMPSLPTVQLQ